MPNHLASETSLYLRQHRDNPVDWYPWGKEALEKAGLEDKPIFLSIGYSACHWCHVMAHESFEDEQVAAILNRHFVSVRVDREERPDLDRIYMAAVQALTGRGGWPMSLFLTPEGMPFYGGTYYPPTPRYGMPSFSGILLRVADAWQKRRQELIGGGGRVVAAVERHSAMPGSVGQGGLIPESLGRAFRELLHDFDGIHGGWGGGPKFPQPMALEFLLRHHHTRSDPQALQMVTQTLEAMARGGMYDQLGGGFHRYSVDDDWLTPHFEKMLYDNAQLARVYLHAWQVTGDPFFRTICEEILDYVLREMTDPLAGFYSTQDADSEGEEGKFFVWTPGEIRSVLRDEASSFIAAYGVTARGNFEGKSILEFVGEPDQRPGLAGARKELFEARRRRVHPGRDEKVLASWNGLMLAAFAEAARVLNRDDYRQAAERNAGFLLRELRLPGGRLLHSWRDGRARFNGYLEDYSFLIAGLLEVYQTTFEPSWYVAAQELTETMIAHFQAPDGGFFDTSDDHETLITRPRDLQDNATPSGNAMAAWVLLYLSKLALEPRYAEMARRSLKTMQASMTRYPLGFAQWLIALAFAVTPSCEIAIIGDPGAPDARALIETCTAGYRPHCVVAAGMPFHERSVVPLLQGRGRIDGRTTAFVCRDFACAPPVTNSAGLRALLD